MLEEIENQIAEMQQGVKQRMEWLSQNDCQLLQFQAVLSVLEKLKDSAEK